MNITRIAIVALAIFALGRAGQAGDPAIPYALSGLASSTPATDEQAFRQPSGDLAFGELIQFQRGKALFDLNIVNWLKFEKGIGPSTRNADSCVACHLSGGRNAIKQEGFQVPVSAPIVLTSFDSVDQVDCVFHGESPTASSTAQSAKRRQTISWIQDRFGRRSSDDRILVYPQVEVKTSSTEKGNCNPSVRITPSLIGAGLLEAVSDSDIELWYSEHLLGKISRIRLTGSDVTIGRFGYKATERSVAEFVSSALRSELGIANPETIGQEHLNDISFYVRELAVPKRQYKIMKQDQGFEIFQRSGCAECHRPSYNISRQVGSKTFPLTIWPFTDLLLHDLGYNGGPEEKFWRTSPLWGVGRVKPALGFGAYMHDGRARTIEEAIIWHSGEATGASRNFSLLTDVEKESLLSFLGSL
ncbi:di-heme oxidoredictase family protein [Phyllobacterium pellucidum]|uniref:di-heme oxidoredictase family protein n=1 Tax=Phyllobacterium pellucidum TaxID=2740464 RepID=UPI001D144385|nr:di-heme oxidoredictase family protein [Phyllobacterium sp. T1018]UGY10189.1 hypothetical protein LLE51_003125 [Phyllobacterium sp. T1018]